MVRNPVQKCRCHFGIAKDRHPLPELQIGCNDDAGLFIKLADEMEQQRPARFWERDVSQFINNHTIHLGQLANDFASVSFRLFPDQGVDKINSIVEACLLTLIDERRAQSNGDVGFTGSGAADKD